MIKINKILSFIQSNWLKKYVDFNTEKRKKSPDEFSKNMYKLLNNCIYGKSIENIRQRINVKLINDKKSYLKCVNKPNFISQKIYDRNFVAVHCAEKSINTEQIDLYRFLGFRIVKIINAQVSL